MHDGPVIKLGGVVWFEAVILVGYAVMCLLCLLLIIYLRVNRREAFKGDIYASRKIILPAFEPLLWILAFSTGVYVVFFSVALSTQLYTVGFPNIDREWFYAGRQFVFVLVLMFLCQKSVSGPALRSAVARSLLLSCYTVPVVYLFTIYLPSKLNLLFFVKLGGRPLLLVVVVYVTMIRPPVGRANPQVLRLHGWFITTYHIFLVLYSLSQQYFEETVWYPILTYVVVIWSSFCPLLIWWLLRADTEYWRGMGKRACSLQHVVHHTTEPANTVRPSIVNENTSSHGLHVLIEVHRKFLIDFAHLELKGKINAATNAIMFHGVLRSRADVAVKVYTPRHFTEEVVAEFSHEAALCASLTHPNIVEFYGMCVCPPTICLVAELCQCTLEEMLLAQVDDFGQHGGASVQRMELTVAYMLDCARAVAYVHSFTPPFLHRDIKPANFLLDGDNTVKLTDFSDSRRLPNELPVSSAGIYSSGPQPISKQKPLLKPKMTVTGTVDYMAPEMIGSRTGLATYAEAADVYSLAITFWDMLHPGHEKYPDTNNNHWLVFEEVLGGSRPPLEFDDDDDDEFVPLGLRELILSAWQKDPDARPTAQDVVSELEKIQEELLAVLAQDLLETENEGCSPVTMPLSGERVVDRMEELRVIQTDSEGLRLGRALMDAGFLHHLEHNCGFRNNDSSLYVLDDDNISFCQPLAILEEVDGSQESDIAPHVSQSCPGYQLVSSSSKPKLRKRERLLSHLTSTFSSSVQSGSESGRSLGSDCACRLLGRLENVPMTPVSGRKRRRKGRAAMSRNSSASSIFSHSNSTSLLTPKRWNLRRKTEPENSLRSRLLEGEQQQHVIDFGLDVVTPSALV